MAPRRGESYVWTDSEVELLLSVTPEYEVNGLMVAIRFLEQITAVLDDTRGSIGCSTAGFQQRLSALVHGENAPSLFLMEVDKSHVELHRADRARQEVRLQNGIVQFSVAPQDLEILSIKHT